MREYDSKNLYPFFNRTTKAQEVKKRQILLFAKKCKENGLDLCKRMDQMLKYAKVATIRDEQKILNKKLESEMKKKEDKLDLMMELERLKGIKKEEEEKNKKKLKKIEEAKIIIEQMKDKKIRKEKERQDIIKEGEELKKHIIELEQKDLILEQKKKIEKLKLAKEIVENNQKSVIEKEKKFQEERDNDLKILKYNMQKAKKEEEEIMQKKLIQRQKELETQKLREKQEKISDNNALLDELRAKRYVEEIDRKERQKELIEAKKLFKQKQLLIEINEEQKGKKKIKMIEQALNEEKEYEDMIKHQLKEKEEEKMMEILRKKTLEENEKDVLRQIIDKKEKKIYEKRYKLEEGRILKQNQDNYLKILERIKLDKLREMEKLGINPRYRVDLQKIKIV